MNDRSDMSLTSSSCDSCSSDTVSATLPGGRMCDMCIYREGMNEQLKFITRNDRFLCSECDDLLQQPIDPQKLMEEFESALKMTKTPDGQYDGILAYSGGRDSTIALKLLVERGLNILAITVDQGMKGKETRENIDRAISHFKVDWMLLHAFPGVKFREMLNKGLSVCDTVCAKAWKLPAYQRIAKTYGVKAIFTGGDTPKDGHCVNGKEPLLVRVVAAHNLKKKELDAHIADVPWQDPGLGPYDTDCLMSPYEIENSIKANGGIAPKLLTRWVAERVRMGLLDRDEELNRLNQIPVLHAEGKKQLETFVGFSNSDPTIIRMREEN